MDDSFTRGLNNGEFRAKSNRRNRSPSSVNEYDFYMEIEYEIDGIDIMTSNLYLDRKETLVQDATQSKSRPLPITKRNRESPLSTSLKNELTYGTSLTKEMELNTRKLFALMKGIDPAEVLQSELEGSLSHKDSFLLDDDPQILVEPDQDFEPFPFES